MGTAYRILLIAEEENDVNLIQLELDKLDLEYEFAAIHKKEELAAQLEDNFPDVVISDFELPSLTGFEVLNIVRERDPYLPCILISDHIKKEEAIDAMIEGVSDYVMKENLDRLGPAVLREIDDYEQHRRKQQKLEETRERYESLVKSVNGIVWEADAETFAFSYVSPQAQQILGYDPETWLQTPDFWQDHIHPDDRQQALNYCRRQTRQEKNHSFEYRMIDADDEIVWLRDYVTVVTENDEPDRLRGLMVDISKEKKAQWQRDKAYDIANIGHWELDLIHDELFWSETVKKLHGVDADFEPDLETGINFYKEGKHRQKISDAVEKAIETGESFDLELKIITANDRERWVRVVGETEVRNGKSMRIYGSTQDITKRKTIEQKLRDIVEYSTNMFYRHDTDHVLSYVSPQSKDFLGCSPEEAKRRWTEFVTDHPVNEEGFKRTQKAIETGRAQPPFPLELQKTNGEIIWVRVNEAPITENGETIAIVGSLTDITEQKEYEEQLQESLERYEYVTKATSDAVWDWNLRKDTVFWGKGFENLFGYDLEELANDSSSWTNHIHPDDKEWVYESIQETIQGDEQNWFEEYRYLRADGSYAFVEDRGFVIRDPDGEPVRMIGAMRDVSEEKKAEIHSTLKQEISRFFKTEGNLDAIVQNVLQYLADFGGFDTAEVWLTSFNEQDLNLLAFYGKGNKGQTFYDNSEQVSQFTKGEGLPGAVWESGEVKIWDDIDTRNSFIRNEAAQQAGLESAVGIPLFHNENLVAVLLFGNSGKGKDNLYEIDFYRGLRRFLGAEIKRKQQEEELRLLFESAPDILAIVSPEGRFTTVNPAFCELTGYTEEELTGQPFIKYVHPEDIEATKEAHRKKFGSDDYQAGNFINRYRTKSGEYRWLSWSSSKAYGEDGLVFAYARDVTAEKEAEQEKIQILERIDDAFFAVDEDWTVTYWNKRAEEVLDRPRETIVGKNLWEEFDDAVELDFYTQYHKAVEEQVTVNFEEFYPGSGNWFEVSAYPSETGLSVYFRDITERKENHEQLKQLNKELEEHAEELAATNEELEQFAYVASHDLQEPLRMVSSFLKRLEKKYSGQLDEKAQQYIDFAVDGAERMRRIILDLLNYSRMNQQEIEREEIDLNALLNDIVKLEQAAINESAATIQWDGLSVIKAARTPMRQVFENLINNAIKYRKPDVDPEVTIESSETDEHWQFSVSDNGIGIKEEFQENIFTIFQRLHTQDEYSGTGIGLSVSQKIVEKHGGEMWVESAEGEGSTFYFTIAKE